MKGSLKFSSLLLVMLTAPAESKCYSKWYYPYPQHCKQGIYARAAEDHSWYVEITALPPNIERDMAIDKLKEQLK
jgi:hypothetical protein